MSTVAAAKAREQTAALDVEKIRADFPILHRKIHGDKRLVFLDNAASSQRPRQVIERIRRVYEEEYANIHRGVYYLSQTATAAYDEAREKVRAFINARNTHEVIFTRGTTESINLVASSYGREFLGRGDEILITGMEHHSNIVPWQIVSERTGAKLHVVPVNDDGTLNMRKLRQAIGPTTRMVAVVHLSNALGTINPIAEIVEEAHAYDAPVLIDAAQSAPHLKLDVQALGCDFLAFSGHKMYGPSGIGVLYGKAALLDDMPPYQGGGDMINSVTFEKTTYADLPSKFEAGTPNIAGAIGLGAAVDYIESVGRERIAAHELDLLNYATEQLGRFNDATILGLAPEKASVLSFVVRGVHPHDVGTVLDSEGVAVRTGHHCAQPLMARFGVPATVRASFAMYNTRDEVDALVSGLEKVREVFG